jgi:multicomponent Na+:H+ antiporter subunit D
MNVLILLPVLIPFITAVIALLARDRVHVQRWLALGGTLALTAAGLALLAVVATSGIQATQIGNWPAPFGITLVADLFSAIMVVIAGIVGLSVIVFSFVTVDARLEQHNYYPLVMALLMGVCGSFLTGDIFNLYVWFEVMLIASFVLMALGGERAQIEGAIKYFALNLLGSALFLTAVGLLYGLTGTLNLAHLAQTIGAVEQQGMVQVVAMLFLVAFGIKAAIFPLYFWLPASYHTPPIAITTLFSGLMTKVGVYAIVRMFTLVFIQDTAYTHTLILIIAGLTMVTGVLGAVAQYDIRRLLSFHIISQIGYLLLGLGLFTVAGLAGTVYFMAHVIIAKSALFLVSGVAQRVSGTYDLRQMGGLYKGWPLLALLFLLPALSLAGIPPLSGFWAKLALIQASLAPETAQYALVAVALAVSVLTLFSMTKIWAMAFWEDSGTLTTQAIREAVRAIPAATGRTLLAPLALMVILTVGLGLLAQPFLVLATQAAEQLMHPADYIQAVLGIPEVLP